jgi:diguanylate cyclase (GGDEF)-like protein
MSCAIFLYGRKNSQRRQFAAEKLLEFMSITDRLTGIYNRGRFEFVLNLWIKGMRHDPFCLLLFDIDDFKEVNDRLGHSAGDKVLIEITQTVTANIRGDDVFARWGGEEFVILFGTTDLAQAAELAERLRKAVEDNRGGEAEKVTISIGVAQYRRDETILDFINRADEKMYEAKRAGKNQVVAERPA